MILKVNWLLFNGGLILEESDVHIFVRFEFSSILNIFIFIKVTVGYTKMESLPFIILQIHQHQSLFFNLHHVEVVKTNVAPTHVDALTITLNVLYCAIVNLVKMLTK